MKSKHNILLALAFTWLLIVQSSYSVYNGLLAAEGQFPYLVYVIANYGDNEHAYACGGAIISSRYVMTAAHCSIGGNFRVIIKTLNVNGYSSSNLITVTSVMAPTDFGSLGFDYDDVAIFTLERDVAEEPGQLEYLSIGTTTPPPGTDITIAGYGQTYINEGTSIVHYNTLTVADASKCTFSDFNSTVSICTYNTNSYPCDGDSGSPIVVKPDGYSKYVAVGIDSYGHTGECGNKLPDTVLGRVSYFIDFIKANTPLAAPTFVSVQFPTTSPQTTTPSPTPSCDACPAGYSHWWEFGLSSAPDGTQCQCIPGTVSPTSSSPTTTASTTTTAAPGSVVVIYQTPAPAVDNAPRSGGYRAAISVALIIATLLASFIALF